MTDKIKKLEAVIDELKCLCGYCPDHFDESPNCQQECAMFVRDRLTLLFEVFEAHLTALKAGDNGDALEADLHNWMDTHNAPPQMAHDLLCKHYATIRSALTSGHKEGWRPIETAPKNISVIGFIPNAEHYGHGVYRCIKIDMGTGVHWSVSGLHMGRDTGPDYEPTHWMPLPTAPKMEE